MEEKRNLIPDWLPCIHKDTKASLTHERVTKVHD